MAFEIPLYRFRNDVSLQEANAMVLRLNEFLKDASGFGSRKTFYDEKSEVWIDLVEWETMGNAIAGFAAFSRTDLCQDFTEVVDPHFNLMHHADVVQEFRKN